MPFMQSVMQQLRSNGHSNSSIVVYQSLGRRVFRPYAVAGSTTNNPIKHRTSTIALVLSTNGSVLLGL